MIISGVSWEDLEAARDVASQALGNELVFYDFDSLSPKRHRFMLKVGDIDGQGARRHSHSFHAGYSITPRRSRYACSHAYGYFYVAVYEREPKAKIQTVMAYYKDVWDFLGAYQSVLDRNIGSLYYPARYGDECTCVSDSIPTDTLEPLLWREPGDRAEVPNTENTETVGVSHA